MNAEEWYKQEYLRQFPNTLVNWLEDLCTQLDCPEPDPLLVSGSEYFKRYGAWETQMIILKKLRYAINYERKNETEKERAIK